MPWDLMGFTIQNLSIFQIHSAANLMGSETRIFFPFAICNTVLYTVAGKIIIQFDLIKIFSPERESINPFH
jgi:hypothetical protein